MSNFEIGAMMYDVWVLGWVAVMFLVASKVIELPWKPAEYPHQTTTVLACWPISMPILISYQLIWKLTRRKH